MTPLNPYTVHFPQGSKGLKNFPRDFRLDLRVVLLSSPCSSPFNCPGPYCLKPGIPLFSVKNSRILCKTRFLKVGVEGRVSTLPSWVRETEGKKQAGVGLKLGMIALGIQQGPKRSRRIKQNLNMLWSLMGKRPFSIIGWIYLAL